MKAPGLLAGLLLAACQGDAELVDLQLPALSASTNVSVSGVSAGAYMATQYQVAFSSEVIGAGLVAGGPWGCAAGDINRALGGCMNGNGINVESLLADLARLAGDAKVDATAGLQDDAVYLFRGSADNVLAAGVTDAAVEFYNRIAPGIDLQLVTDVPAVHGWPTLAAGLPCDEFATPFINACNVDVAGEMLRVLHGSLQPPAQGLLSLQKFSQQPYSATGMAEDGLLLVPPQCNGEKVCDIHVFFHGCGQAISQVGTAVAEQTGLRRWAQTNDLIVVYPQIAPSKVMPVNPLACWDWWGYSGENYLERNAPQLQAVHAMVRRLQSSD